MAQNNRNLIFPFSYNICRKNPSDQRKYEKAIFQGFGLEHKDTTTNIYVSSLNTTGRSAVSQPIGEAIGLVGDIILAAHINQPIAVYKTDKNDNYSFLEITIPEKYRTNLVVPNGIQKYQVLIMKNNTPGISDTIWLNAIDSHNHIIPDVGQSNGEIHYHHLNKLLPIFTLLLLNHKSTIPEFSETIERFAFNPSIEDFVRIHEDFYNMNKSEEFGVCYEDRIFCSFIDIQTDLEDKEYYSKALSTNERKRNAKHIIINQFNTDDFSLYQQSQIPHLPKEIILPAEYRAFCNAVHDGAAVATLFHGPSGTGKSMLCKLICQAINLPVMQTINCSENLDEYIFGKYIPKEDKIIFHENPITEAVRNGGAAIFEEINFAKPQHLAFMHSLLDDNGMITLDDGTVIKRHPNFRLFATMNDGYFGTKELNQATINRFNYIREVPELSDEAIKNMLATRIPQYAKYTDQILQVYKGIKSKAEAEDIDITISPRNLENWAKIAQYEGFITAAKSTILPVAKMDRKLEKAILGIINTHKWAA